MSTTRVRPWHRLKQRMYRGGRPGPLARAMNAVAAWQYAHGVLTVGGRGVTLEVRGRASGRPVRVPLVLVRQQGERYLVSMLGTDAQWVRNVRADEGRAVLHAPRPEPVRLVEVPVEERAPVLRRYLAIAPGARPHVAVDRHAPLARFAEVAADYPVLRVEPR
ncbi:nitroreductase/quinone reductase family protein [Cellulomonas fimi]|uniref:nitroreductase/quinone reductase family protein n=1 Tax=Cellulomonas fimi TaxID=1708 RepID=UPI002358EC98|nr:nitroreductase/quinone reductase family protein [Cellulomonas fimi]